jgi:hypothetical protein
MTCMTAGFATANRVKEFSLIYNSNLVTVLINTSRYTVCSVGMYTAGAGAIGPSLVCSLLRSAGYLAMVNITTEIFAGINMFLARLKLILMLL